MEEQIKELLVDILNIDPNSVDESTSMDNTASWDSMNHLNICLSIEQEFGITLEIFEIESMISFYDVVQVVETKL
ncbi:MAG: acyl carrier protein [Thiotrichaceae bacterium]|nr:acyl carrier protein [Thiotrichaceae bacterium]